MKKTMSFLVLEVLLVPALVLLLLPGAKCQGPQGGGRGANITVTGTVFCDACSSSSFSNHSYFLPGVKVRIDCMIRVNFTSKEEIKITAEKSTNSYGAYQLDIPAIDGLECTTGGETVSFCRAAVLDNPSTLCDVPAVTTTAGHIAFSTQEPSACLYSLNSLYYRPGKKGAVGRCEGGGTSTAPAALNTSLFYCPHWPWPPIPFCTPRPWFPPIPFFTPPPPAFPFPLPPIPFFTPPSPPPPAFPIPFAALAMDATAGATSTGFPIPTFATNFLNAVSAAAAAACIPVPFAADSTPTSFSAFPATAVVVFTTASPTPATTSATFVSLAFPATTFLPSNYKPFDPISSTFKALSERSKHLVLF